jgi:HAD superfamily hydrolase (TIGR01509 family)
MIISFQHQLLKPEPQIYRELLEGYGLHGEECLFIDDVPANVEGARRMGIKAILYQSPNQLHNELLGRL